jgi:putative effector of murein hydrolase LrgA (UPF0299 family)
MYSTRSQILALVLLALCAVFAALLAGVVAFELKLPASAAVGLLALFAALVAGIVKLNAQIREARWDAGLRLR